MITSCAPRSAAASLTGQAVDHRRPLLLVLLLWRGAVLSVHLADGGCAFALDLRVKLLVEQNLVHQVRLHGAGLGRGLRGPVVVAWNEERKTGTAKCTGEYVSVNTQRISFRTETRNDSYFSF